MISRLSPEDVLLIFLSVLPTEEKIKRRVLYILKKENNLNWHSIVGNAVKNNVYPQLYYNLMSLPSEERVIIPKKVMKTLKNIYSLSIARSMVCLDILKKTLKACGNADIKVMLIKGAILAEKIYPQRHLRVMDDIDILIPRIDEEKKKIFDSIQQMLINIQKKYRSMYLYVHFHNSWIDTLDFWSGTAETKRIWERAEDTKIGDIRVQVMSSEDILLLVCYHAFIHARINLRDLCDVFLVLKNNRNGFEWDYVYNVATKTNIALSLYFMLYLANYFFNVKEIPSNFFLKLEKIREVKLLKFFVHTWSMKGRFFQIVLEMMKLIYRLKFFGLLRTMDFYLKKRRRLAIILTNLDRAKRRKQSKQKPFNR